MAHNKVWFQNMKLISNGIKLAACCAISHDSQSSQTLPTRGSNWAQVFELRILYIYIYIYIV